MPAGATVGVAAAAAAAADDAASESAAFLFSSRRCALGRPGGPNMVSSESESDGASVDRWKTVRVSVAATPGGEISPAVTNERTLAADDVDVEAAAAAAAAAAVGRKPWGKGPGGIAAAIPPEAPSAAEEDPEIAVAEETKAAEEEAAKEGERGTRRGAAMLGSSVTLRVAEDDVDEDDVDEDDDADDEDDADDDAGAEAVREASQPEEAAACCSAAASRAAAALSAAVLEDAASRRPLDSSPPALPATPAPDPEAAPAAVGEAGEAGEAWAAADVRWRFCSARAVSALALLTRTASSVARSSRASAEISGRAWLVGREAAARRCSATDM